MKLLGRKKDEGVAGDRGDASASADAEATVSAVPQTTAPKGRPTPRRDAGRRGPVAPAPMTSSEARARRKAVAGPKLSR
ncbi:MAG TPA: DUF3043 domain-containing protein, partial [Pseudonocardiaceae bacterium]|nr:DUF3043 domain-containing protein [Pseudonocardiaceae bacterium]